MPLLINLSNKRFGSLLVISDGGRDAHGAVLWRCKCDCGKSTLVRGSSLTQGSTRSCGCGVTCAARRARTHGQSNAPLYRSWQSMKSRCNNPKNADYRNYGGRGIVICLRWSSSFEAFSADMGPSFFENAELDRKDNNGPYEPGNCRWLTHSAQQRNKRSNHLVAIGGVNKTLIEWSEETGLKANTILTRIRRGWPESRLLEIANQ